MRSLSFSFGTARDRSRGTRTAVAERVTALRWASEGRPRRGSVRHGHEGESAHTSGLAISGKEAVGHLAILRKQILQLCTIGDVKAEVGDEQLGFSLEGGSQKRQRKKD